MLRSSNNGPGYVAIFPIIILAFLMISTSSTSALAVTDDTLVDNGSSFSRDPVVGVNSTGVILAIWQDYRNLANNDIYAAKSINNGQSFVGDVRVDDSSSGNQMVPDMIIGSDDTIHAVWQDSRGTSDDIYYANSTDGGSSFNTNTRIDDSSSGQQRNPAIAILGTTIHVVWEDTRNGNYDIYYSKSSDNGDTWSTNVRVDNTGAASSAQRYPDVCVDSAGRILVVWQDNRNGNYDIYFASSTNGGTSFNTNIRVDDTGSGTSSQEQPVVSVDSTAEIHVAWQDNRNGNYDIYYSNSTNNGASFNSDLRVDDSSSGDQQVPAITSDINDVVHVVWQDKRNSVNPDIYHSNTTSDGTFDSDSRVDNSTSGSQDLPGIATDGNANIFFVWDDDRNGNDDIYFCKNSNSQPDTPTLTAPANGAWINTSIPTFNWTFSDPDPSDGQTAFRLQVLDATTVIYDSGTVLSSSGTHTVTSAIGDGTHTWKVRTRDSNGAWSYFSTPWVVRIDTSIPTAMIPIGPGVWSTSTSVQWTWTSSIDSPSGIDGYYICIGTSAGSCDIISDDWITTNQYIFNGGTNGVTYYAKVKAKDIAGNVGGYGPNSADTTVDSQAPTTVAPTDSGVYTKSTSITWDWTASSDQVSGVAGYYICIGSAPGQCDIVYDGWTTVLNYTYFGAENGRSYYAKIKAKDNATNIGGYGSNSDGITVDTVAPTAGRPIDEGRYIPSPTVIFRWANSTDDISGIKGYYISIGTLPGGNDVVTDIFVSMANYTYTGASNGNTYYATVKAVDNATNIGQSSLSSDGVTVDLTSPPVPLVYDDGLTNQNDVAKVWWDASEDLESGIQRYNVQLLDGPNIIKEANTTLTTYKFVDVVPFLTHGRIYTFKVRGLNGAGNFSQWGLSGGLWIDTMINDTEEPMHDGLYSNSSAVVWTWPALEDRPAGILGYLLDIGTTIGGSDILSGVMTSSNGYTFTGGVNNAIYYISITAVDLAGNHASRISNQTGVMVDTTPPRVSTVTDDGPFSPSTNLTFKWTGYPDTGSGIDHFEIAIGTTAYGEDVLIARTDELNFTFENAETGKTYYAKVRAMDRAGNIGDWGLGTDGIAVDISGPSAPTLISPKAYVNTLDHLSIEWTPSEDPTSGISTYMYKIGFAQGQGDIVNWTSVVTTKVNVDGLFLVNGKKYYLSIKALNGAGSESNVLDAEVTIDTVAPTGPTDVVSPQFSNTNVIIWSWSGAFDDSSGIGGYYISVGSTAGSSDYVSMEFVIGETYTFGSGIHAKDYHISIYPVDKAGNTGIPTMIGPVTVDIVPPQIISITRTGAYSHEHNVGWSWTGLDSVSGIEGYWVMISEIGGDSLDPVFVLGSEYNLSEGIVEGHIYDIEVQPKDKANNLGDFTHGDGITVDTIPPKANITINDQATNVNSRAVTVRIITDQKDIYLMMIGNDMDLSGSNWEPFSPSRSWYLTNGDGDKQVYVQLRDLSGLLSPQYMIKVTLDTQLPKLDLDLPADVVSDASLPVRGKTEPGSMITVNGRSVSVDTDGGFKTKVELKEGTNLVTIVAIDDAGNQVKVSRAINREAFSLPSSVLLIIMIILLIGMIISIVWGARANKRLKRLEASMGSVPERGSPLSKNRIGDRTSSMPKHEIDHSKDEEEIHEEMVLDRTGANSDIIAKIRSEGGFKASGMVVNTENGSDETTLEREDLTIDGTEKEDDLNLEEDFEDEKAKEDGSAPEDDQEGTVFEEEQDETDLEMDETPTVPLARVRCNQCSHIISIYSAERPLKIECANCGKIGMIRK